MPRDQEEQRRSATTQAAIAIAVLLLALGVAGYFALRDTGRAAGSLAQKARELLEREPEAAAPAVSEASAPPDGAATSGSVAAEAGAAADAIAAAASTTEPATIQDALAACLPTLMSLAEGVRILAVNASATNVDFVQESASTPGRFVRLGCEWTGGGWNFVDAGRMLVPPMVGDVERLPAVPVERNSLGEDFYSRQIRAAATAAREPGLLEVKRVEISHVAGRGALTRVRMTRSAGPLDIVLDSAGNPLPETTPFPQVERMAGVTEEEAQRGYRDHGQMLWTLAVAESMDSLRDDYLQRNDRLHALEMAGRQVTAYIAAGGGDSNVLVIDEYGDRAETGKQVFQPGQCARPFSPGEARAALDVAMRERGETLAQFEARQFDTAIIDCSEHPRTPKWRFGGG